MYITIGMYAELIQYCTLRRKCNINKFNIFFYFGYKNNDKLLLIISFFLILSYSVLSRINKNIKSIRTTNLFVITKKI